VIPLALLPLGWGVLLVIAIVAALMVAAALGGNAPEDR
jgi:hypothetical protein